MGCIISCCKSACWTVLRAYFDKDLRAATQGADFSLQDKEFLCKVVQVYDGDTIRVVFRRQGELMQHRVRMSGYDSPEMKPPRKDPNRDLEIQAAKAARDALKELIQGSTAGAPQLVWLVCGKPDKYGRLLGTIYQRSGWCGHRKGANANQWMMDNGHGIPYDGGKKRAFVARNGAEQAEGNKEGERPSSAEPGEDDLKRQDEAQGAMLDDVEAVEDVALGSLLRAAAGATSGESSEGRDVLALEDADRAGEASDGSSGPESSLSNGHWKMTDVVRHA